MKRLNIISLTVAVFMLSAPLSPAVAAASIAVVNVPKLVSESPQAAEIRRRMDREFSSRRQQLESEQQQLIADLEQLKKDAAVMSESQTQQKQEQLIQRQQQLAQKQQVYNQDVARKEQQELGELRKTILEVVEQVAKSKRFDIVLGNSVVYAEDKYDLTNDVLAIMQKRLR